MIEDQLAALHARAMTIPQGWNISDFKDICAGPGTFLVVTNETGVVTASPGQSMGDLFGFALGRVVLDEAELLTLAVDPTLQGQGYGRNTLAAFETSAAERGAKLAFLEVAVSNQAARRLYGSAGWVETGTRPAYYKVSGERHDALLMSKTLTAA